MTNTERLIMKRLRDFGMTWAAWEHDIDEDHGPPSREEAEQEYLRVQFLFRLLLGGIPSDDAVINALPIGIVNALPKNT